MSFRRMRHVKCREIQGCQVALDASIASTLYDATSGGALVAADGAVARWEDVSGNGYHVTQSGSTLRPLRRVANQNGLDAIEFDSTDDRLINSSLTVVRPTTVFVAGKTARAPGVFVDSYGSSQHVIYRGGGGDYNGKFVAAGGGGNSATTADDALWGGLVGTFSSSAGKSIMRGSVIGTTSENATNNLSGVSVGNLRGNPAPLVSGYQLGGFVGEVAVWNAILNQSLRRRLNDSRIRKWRSDR